MNQELKKYYPNLVNLEFVVAQPNIHWYVDFTQIEILTKDKSKEKFYLLFVLDGCFNEIIEWSVAKNEQISDIDTVKTIELALQKRKIPIVTGENEEAELIIHTDRGNQFAGEVYFQFTEKCKKMFKPSMSPMNSPIHNAVAERFVKTLKNLKISDSEFNIQKQNIQEFLQLQFQSDEKKEVDMFFVKKVFARFVEIYNREKKTKKAKKGANKNQQIFEEGKEFLKKPSHNQAYSKYAMNVDHRREEIESYKMQLVNVWTEVNEALPDNISFQLAKPILLAKLKLIDEKMDRQFHLSLNTDENVTDLLGGQKLTMTAIGQVALAIETLREEVQQLKNKNPKKEKTEKIRVKAPVYKNHYDFFMLRAGESIKKKLKSVRTAQLRILYTLLYLCGLRLHEVKKLTKKDLLLAIQTAEFNIFHPPKNTCQKYVLPENGKKILEQLLPEIELIFDEYGFQFLGNSKPFSETTFSTFHFFKFVNEDMRKICEKEGMLENFTSDSFRVGYIAKLLRTVPIQKVASIVGHKDTKATMSYQRYVIDKDEIQRVLKDSFDEN